MSTTFQTFQPAEVAALTVKRPGEIKLGQRVAVPTNPDWRAALYESDAYFIIIGIPEDIGVRANGGIGGAHTAPAEGLKALLNVQESQMLEGRDMLVLGQFDFGGWMQAAEGMPVETLRQYVEEIDLEVAAVVREIIAAGKFPVAIGGGHNNCYGMLRGSFEARQRPVNAINLDAHADFRALEGRHSGNGFRYAREHGYLDAYAMLGLHENYNNPAILSQLTVDGGFSYSYYEAIYVRRERSLEQALSAALAHVAEGIVGVELDLDSVAGVLSSATTPSGVPMEDARRYAWRCGREADSVYLHLCEGVARRADGLENPLLGKTIAYLATDFMKGLMARRRSMGL